MVVCREGWGQAVGLSVVKTWKSQENWDGVLTELSDLLRAADSTAASLSGGLPDLWPSSGCPLLPKAPLIEKQRVGQQEVLISPN